MNFWKSFLTSSPHFKANPFLKKIGTLIFVDSTAYEKLKKSTEVELPVLREGGLRVNLSNGDKIIFYNARGDYSKFKVMMIIHLVGDPHPFVIHFRLGRSKSFIDFPPGYQIGLGKLYPFSFLDPSIQRGMTGSNQKMVLLDKEIKKAGSGEVDLTNTPILDILNQRLEEDMFMKVEVMSAVGRLKAGEIAARHVTRSIGIMKLFYGVPTDRFFGTIVEKFYSLLHASPFEYHDGQGSELSDEDAARAGFKFDGAWGGGHDTILGQMYFVRDTRFDKTISVINQIIAKEESHPKQL
jgi:hypothetical protein